MQSITNAPRRHRHFSHYRAAIYALILGTLLPLGGVARAAADEVGPEAVVTSFVAALDDLDLNGVMTTLSDDSTMFFPHQYANYRLNGKPAIHREMEKAFVAAYAQMKAAGRNQPPYLGIRSGYFSTRKIQMLGERGAVISWVADRPGNFGRRSASLRQEADGSWKIVNYHSSNLISDR